MTFREETSETFEKTRGRPPEDTFARQFEIFHAILPLLEYEGASRLTMRTAAEAACTSVSTLYHYFPTKRDMLLFPLQPKPCTEQLRRFEAQHAQLRSANPVAYVHAFINEMVQTFPLVRASLAAAVELGTGDFWKAMDEALGIEIEERLLVLVSADMSEQEVRSRARSLRRSFMGATLDRSIDPLELREQLLQIVSPEAPHTQGLEVTG